MLRYLPLLCLPGSCARVKSQSPDHALWQPCLFYDQELTSIQTSQTIRPSTHRIVENRHPGQLGHRAHALGHVQSKPTASDHRRVCENRKCPRINLMTPPFRGSTGSFGVPLSGDSEHPTPGIATLDTYALEKWEVIWSGSTNLNTR